MTGSEKHKYKVVSSHRPVDSASDNTDSLSYLSNFTPLRERKNPKKRSGDSYSDGTESLEYLDKSPPEKEKRGHKLTITKYDDQQLLNFNTPKSDKYSPKKLSSTRNTDRRTDDTSQISANNFIKTDSLFSDTASAPSLNFTDTPTNKTHSVIMEAVLRHVAAEPAMKRKNKKRDVAERYAVGKCTMRVNVHRVHKKQPEFQICRQTAV